MDSEQGQPPPVPWVPPSQAPTKGSRHWRNLKRIVVGAAVSFITISLLYGMDQAVLMIGLAVICTAGIGLIPILFLSWIVGWILFAIVEANKHSDTAPAS